MVAIVVVLLAGAVAYDWKRRRRTCPEFMTSTPRRRATGCTRKARVNLTTRFCPALPPSSPPPRAWLCPVRSRAAAERPTRITTARGGVRRLGSMVGSFKAAGLRNSYSIGGVPLGQVGRKRQTGEVRRESGHRRQPPLPTVRHLRPGSAGAGSEAEPAHHGSCPHLVRFPLQPPATLLRSCRSGH